MTGTQGKTPFFLMARRKTLSPEVTYSVCKSAPPNTTFDGSLIVRLAKYPNRFAGRVDNLDPELRRHVEESVGIHSHPVRAAAQWAGFHLIGNLQPVKGNAIGERPIRLDREGPDPAAQRIGHVQKSMVWREADAIGEQNTLMHNALIPFGIDEPDPLVLRIGEIDLTAGVYRQVIRVHTFGDDGFFAVGCIGDDALTSILASVEAAVRSEHQTVGLARILAEHGDFAIGRNLVDAAVRNIAEEHIPHSRRPPGLR